MGQRWWVWSVVWLPSSCSEAKPGLFPPSPGNAVPQPPHWGCPGGQRSSQKVRGITACPTLAGHKQPQHKSFYPIVSLLSIGYCPNNTWETLALCVSYSSFSRAVKGTSTRNLSELCTARIIQDDATETDLNKSYAMSRLTKHLENLFSLLNIGLFFGFIYLGEWKLIWSFVIQSFRYVLNATLFFLLSHTQQSERHPYKIWKQQHSFAP